MLGAVFASDRLWPPHTAPVSEVAAFYVYCLRLSPATASLTFPSLLTQSGATYTSNLTRVTIKSYLLDLKKH